MVPIRVTKMQSGKVYPTFASPFRNIFSTEYEFKCKPGRIDRRPCVISPFHSRLDWQVRSLPYFPSLLKHCLDLVCCDVQLPTQSVVSNYSIQITERG